ncbi:GcvT family protein [Granulosicoccus antarcticus]|uniref:4-methylaminobutanoate oxidase (Formaldehyde-forming) n=1 Tax=Granulosicoccus antarcticus IMCC3135 TaxID=1192854 RepID=A0A2Z2NZU4_9GAMM|nr:FAD-dependent oxidoreductase [Granulosicoccus antarcticus]ASJ75481.1 4-methylaminobutanoate oxidase (formaldehyde-forming) [Granulosicoccus antarcticus IMCC3135]
MKSSYQTVVIGGGVVGVSVLYHLAKFGWTDVALVERAELTAGSTWHAAAGYFSLNADPNIAALQAYTINLYKEIEAASGQSVGMHETGGLMLASDPRRWEMLKASLSTFEAIGIDTARLVTPDEVREMTGGFIVTDDLQGALYDHNEGYLDPNGVTYAYAGAAKKLGAEVILRNRVLDLNQRTDGSWDIVTEHGTIHTEHVVNAAGLWAKQCGLMAGVDLPVTPMEHHYLVTEGIPELRKRDGELPVIIDLDGFTYSRQERDGLLLGVYERNFKHWMMDGAPWDYGMDLIQPDIDRIMPELEVGFERYPSLADTGIRKWINGGFTFAPDGNPLVGPVGPRGYWVACGVMAGFSQGGGVGKALAEWMIHGQPEGDIYGMDVARFGLHQSNREYIRQTTGQFYARRFMITYPNEELPAGRPLRTPGAYVDMSEAGCRWTQSWGMEAPAYFAPSSNFVEPGTLRRNAAFDIVAKECEAVQNAAGLMDISAYARYEITGPNAEAYLDKLLSCLLPEPGKVKLAPMLAEDGRLKGDLTVFNWGGGIYWLMGSYYLRSWHMRWFEDHQIEEAIIRDMSDYIGGFSLNGPKARELLQSLTATDLTSLNMMSCRSVDLGLYRIKLARLSLSGELAYEINCSAVEHAGLRKCLLEAGTPMGIREIGFRAMSSLRLEKSIGIWNGEFTQAYTPSMTGFDRWIAWDKGNFIGREAARKASAPTQVLRMIEIDASDADARGFEPVRKDGCVIGMTTSGGYGYRMQASYAMALVNVEHADIGNDIIVDIVGEQRPATIIELSPYDPTGGRMRK